MTTEMTRWTFLGASVLGLVGACFGCASRRVTERAPSADNYTESCTEIPEDERRSSPLEPPYTIESISPLDRYLWTGRGRQRRPIQGSGKLTGLLVTIRAPSWTTLEAFDVRLQCHINWMRSSGDDSPAVRSCPLAVPGTSTEVRVGYGEKFIIAITSKDEQAAKEAWRRARALHAGEDAPEGTDRVE